MQDLVKSWITEGTLMRTKLEHWAEVVNRQDSTEISDLYHENARLFPTFGSLKKGKKSIKSYLDQASIVSIKIHYGTLNYHPEDRLAEGEYTFKLADDSLVSASFAFKFSRTGLILEHASAPKNIDSWKVRNEVSICTLLTASTVKSILKRNQALEEVVA